MFSVLLFLVHTLSATERIHSCRVNPIDKLFPENGFYTNCKVPNVVALTYDDGPKGGPTTKILSVLKKHNISATFFVLGESLRTPASIALLQEIHSEGHLIASHTDSHPHLDRMSSERIHREITKADEKIYSIVGVTPRFFRPPYGAYNDRVAEIVCGFYKKKVIMWNLDAMDWEYGSSPKKTLTIFQKALQATCPKCHSWIPLQHDTYRHTAAVQDMLIQYLKSLGYRFVTMDECIGEPGQKYF